jgi:predicted enzyme related to lactoylglutathione lyase
VLASAGAAQAQGPAVGPQFDSTHVYVSPGDVDGFVTSFLATFGGSTSKQVVTQITPTASSASVQLLLTPAGTLSVIGFRTPVPYPFGLERNGYLVRDIDAALKQARADGASLIVATFPDTIGRDAIVQWPGGVNMQFYWHTVAPSYPALKTVPENRVYLSPDALSAFVTDFTRFSRGAVVSNDAHASGVEIGRPGDSYHRVRIESAFGRMVVLATDGHLPYPFGHESTGYEVETLGETLGKAKAAGATVLAGPFSVDGRQAAMVAFPGGYVAEIHALAK